LLRRLQTLWTQYKSAQTFKGKKKKDNPLPDAQHTESINRNKRGNYRLAGPMFLLLGKLFNYLLGGAQGTKGKGGEKIPYVPGGNTKKLRKGGVDLRRPAYVTYLCTGHKKGYVADGSRP